MSESYHHDFQMSAAKESCLHRLRRRDSKKRGGEVPDQTEGRGDSGANAHQSPENGNQTPCEFIMQHFCLS
jgi:hypothetical protein